MTDHREAPWFDDLPAEGRAEYLAQTNAIVEDMRTLADFIQSGTNARAFPVSRFAPGPAVQYFVDKTDPDAADVFAALAKNVIDAGGVAFERGTAERGLQHVAELAFGEGPVAYRVIWIERRPTDG